MTSRALASQTIAPRVRFDPKAPENDPRRDQWKPSQDPDVLDARIAEDNRRIASGERKPYREPDAEAPGFDPGKNMDDWRAEVDGECDEQGEES